MDIDIGADAKDWNAIQAGEKLKPIEMELRRIEEVTAEIVKEMEYLREREISLRDTNESTNERVKWFAIGTMGLLVALGAWQVIYLRAYFRFVFSERAAKAQNTEPFTLQVEASDLMNLMGCILRLIPGTKNERVLHCSAVEMYYDTKPISISSATGPVHLGDRVYGKV